MEVKRKYSETEVNNKLKNRNLIIIEGEYRNCNSAIVVKDEEGYKYLTRIANIMKDGQLNKFHRRNPYTIDNIKLYLNKNYENIILISETYINNNSVLKFKCLKHDFIFEKALEGFKGCPKCIGSYSYSLDETRDILKSINPNIKILREYKNKHNNRLFECECLIDGNIWSASFSDLITFKHGCLTCANRNKIGEGNPYYNHNKTDEERETRREYTEYYSWRNEVYERDNYICICCGYDKGHNLNAHHLNGYNWDKEHRTDVNNGVTLCKNCHDKFHNIYGYGDNTKEQFEEFYKDEFNKNLKSILP